MISGQRLGNFLGFLTAMLIFVTIAYFVLSELTSLFHNVSYLYVVLSAVAANVIYNLIKPKTKKSSQVFI